MSLHKNEPWFVLHSACIPVKGKESSLIYDIEKQELYPISNDHYELLHLCKQFSIPQLKEELGLTDGTVIEDFLAHFIEQHLGFYTNNPQSFPDLDLVWKVPSKITNAIIQLDGKSSFDVEGLILQLQNLGCNAVQLRLEENFELEQIEQYLEAFDGTRIKLIDLMLPYHSKLEQARLFEWMKKYKRLGLLRLYAAPKDDFWKVDTTVILLVEKDIRTNTQEILTQDRMTVNPYVFMEAQHHNVGLNKKVCIDKEGNIKNYLSHEKIWGNITTDSLVSIVLKDSFQEKWLISNDKIEICCDCAFRYCCVNNSDVERKDGKYYKLTPCKH